MNERIAQKSILQSMRQAQYTSDAAKERSFPVYTQDVADKSAVSILEEYIMLWEPRDLRLDPEYRKSHSVETTDDLLMQDLASGMKLQVEERLPTKNAIKVAVLFQHNMSEFERYNDVVDAHNDKWVDEDCPEDVFDPKTGDIYEVEDRYLNHAGDDSPNLFGESTGSLASARPKAKRRKLLTVTYKLDISPNNGMFSLEFSAEDYLGSTVYYNTLRGKNLAYLTRRATQELYGNPEVFGNTGPFLEGISMLVTGKKLGRVHAKNERPEWSQSKVKSPVAEQAILAAEASGLKTIGYLIRFAVPIIGMLVIIIKTFSALGKGTLDGLFPTYGITLLVMYGSVVISGWVLRKSYAVTVERKFT